ncbi:purine-nucleoside phosphorylase [Bacteroidota bacterium]
MLETIKETVSFIKSRTEIKPEVGIILGTGLGGMVKDIDIKNVLKYEDIPNFPVSTVESHHGKLIFGLLNGKRVVAMQGRFHYYEGYTPQEITFPVRVMKYLGITHLFVSNASGGINPEQEIGDLMILDDHINLIPNPLIGKHKPEFGDRFPDMSETYDKDLIERAFRIGRENNFPVCRGCYVSVTGPTLETPKEYQYFRIIGGDAVGMSTVPEIIVAHQMGITCFAISIITDLGVPGKIVKVSLDDVTGVASKAEPQMTTIMKELISGL